jgi:hypothetical protein
VTSFVGIVTDKIGANAATLTLEAVTTAPAATVALSTAVLIDTDDIGTSYTFTQVAVPVLTPTLAGYMTEPPANRWLLPIGSIQATCAAANSGTIKWYMTYKPLSPNSVVVATA